jgi:hypothetical protein
MVNVVQAYEVVRKNERAKEIKREQESKRGRAR